MVDGPLNDAGQFTSTAVNSASAESWKLGIAYTGYYNTDHALRYAEYTCAADHCSWSISTVHMAEGMTSDAASLQYDSEGTPHIAFHHHDELSGHSEISHATYVGSGGNCGVYTAEGAWQCDAIRGLAGGLGQAYPSLALGSGGMPRIAYTDGGVLWYAASGVRGDACGPGGTWSCTAVDDGPEAGLYASLAVDVQDRPHIAYYSATDARLKYATLVGSGGNCAGAAWDCLEITGMPSGEEPVGVSLALDGNGQPVIAFQGVSGSTASGGLQVARPVTTLGLSQGNCGPVDDTTSTWRCEVVDPGGTNLDAGSYASIAINPRGVAIIAYYERDDLHRTGRLKVAVQRFWFHMPVVAVDARGKDAASS
jgi:hypothetical protein